MGLAASQARFLGLTARKTNIEYQGQQINEQRTQLSNQSASLYNQMLTLQVPTPPSTSEYTKINYKFTIPNGTGDVATISQITKVDDTDNQYTILYSYKSIENGFPACSTSQRSATAAHAGYVDPRDTTNATTYDSYDITTTKGKNYTLLKYNAVSSYDDSAHEDAFNSLCKDQKPGGGNDILYYVNVGTDAAPSYQYYTDRDLKASIATDADKKCIYYEAGSIEVYKTDSYSPCTVNRDSSNRVQSFTYGSDELAVTTETITDEAAYNDAYNEYKYKTYLYEQQMNDINSKTSIIQAQDKNLELELKQLDTEHNAIQTELESVKGVIKKNSEDSFKTFA